MSKKLFLIITVLFTQNTVMAQVGVYSAGDTVQPNNNDPIPYDGTTTLGVPGAGITSGDYNTNIGDGAGASQTTGDQNVLVGTAAGALFDGESDNTVIGAFAADQTNTGFDNVYIGTRVARYATGSNNVAIGNEAALNITSGVDNVFIGQESGEGVTTGDNNVYIGDQTGKVATSGSGNVFVGNQVGYSNTTASGNTFVGGVTQDVTDYDGTGFYDIDITNSTRTGRDNTTGEGNTFLGSGAGRDNSVGYANTFIGYGAGGNSEYADGNTFVGFGAGWDNNRTNITTNANRNTYLGVIAGGRNRDGSDNVGMGFNANFNSTTNNRAVFLGSNVLIGGDDNIAIGYNAQATANGIGGGITIGAESSTTGLRSIAVGYDVDVAQANTLALGGDQTTNRLSVGIGTVSANLNASLDLADVDKGFMVNRVTNAERTTMITAPASGIALNTTDAGLMVYDTDDKLLYIWNGTQWGEVGSNAGSGVSAVPELLNYQSSVRDASGAILANQSVSFRMNVIDVTSGDTTVYSETHAVTTSDNGLVNFEIGGGTIVSGLFTDIDWSHNNSLQIELDAAGGTTYVIMGTTSFVSVPYALRAKYAENLTSSTNARISNVSKDDRIEALENEVQELKKLVNQLINRK